MDKNAIKKYAIWARRELIEKVSQKALQYGIEERKDLDPNLESVNGTLLTATEKKQRQALIRKVNLHGYAQVMEEVAYTWFNRFIALRFMEVNGYLPSHVRIFTDENNKFKPQILVEALHLEFENLDRDKILEMKQNNQDEELFRYLIIEQCNDLNAILPMMFQRISDYTELLLPDYLLRNGSVIEQMISLISEDSWKDQVQIIGWLYQYYNSEPKDEVFAALKKNVKISKENIPAATQLFTPDWIVRYMVENSAGKLWVDAQGGASIINNFNYFLPNIGQEENVVGQLNQLKAELKQITPESINCIDPCMGSGHILCYLFDVFVKIYEDYGYSSRDAAVLIVKNNINGLDIDERAAQLAYFAVMMKARQYDRRFFTRDIQPHIYAIKESNNINRDAIEYFCNGDSDISSAINKLLVEFTDAKEYGSILNISLLDFKLLYKRVEEVKEDVNLWREYIINELVPLINIAKIMASKYQLVITNPPYMGSSGMNEKLIWSKINKYHMFLELNM